MERRTNQYLLDFYFNGYKSIPRSRIDVLTRNAVETIIRVCSKYNKICCGYSGGKDAVATLSLMQISGINFQSVLWQTRYQFPKNQEWIKQNTPKDMIWVLIQKPDWNDIERNESLLFKENQHANEVFEQYKWTSQQKFLKANGYDLFVTGRRTKEGNNCGSKSNLYVRKGNNFDVLSPIAEWSVEEVIAYIRYNGLEAPWQYLHTPNGFTFGSVAWIERRRFGYGATINQRWSEIYSVDKSVVEEAAEHLTSARKFLEGL